MGANVNFYSNMVGYSLSYSFHSVFTYLCAFLEGNKGLHAGCCNSVFFILPVMTRHFNLHLLKVRIMKYYYY